jgi:hypothetical protein
LNHGDFIQTAQPLFRGKHLVAAMKGNRLAAKFVFETMERQAYDYDAWRGWWIDVLHLSRRWDEEEANGNNPRPIIMPDPPDTSPPSRRPRRRR